MIQQQILTSFSSVPTQVKRLVLLALVLVAGGAVSAEDASQRDFRVYPLRHAKAADIAPLVQQVLSSLPERADVVVDERANRLLVRAGAEGQRLAGELVSSVDRAARPTVAAKPVLKAYPYSKPDAAAVARRLQGQFPPESGVRIAADRRTRQILVLAPPDLQSQIGEQLGGSADGRALAQGRQQSGGPEAAAGDLPEAQPAGEPARVRRPDVATIKLEHATADEIESALGRLWQERLSPLMKTSDDVNSYLVQLPDGESLEVHVDHRAAEVAVRGPARAAEPCVRLIQALDASRPAGSQSIRVVPVQISTSAHVRQALDAVQMGGEARRPADLPGGLGMVARLFQPRARSEPDTGGPPEDGQRPSETNGAAPETDADTSEPEADAQQPPDADEEAPVDDDSALVGSVQIEYLEGLDAIIVRGNRRDVERVLKIIEEIERLSVETEPVIEVYMLRHAGSEAVAGIIRPLYDEVLSPRQGRVSITALVKPNALLLIGRAESVKTVTELVARLDQPAGPASQFQVFRLRHATAAGAAATITEFFANRAGLGTKVVVTADFRSNSLIVQASPRDLVEVARLIQRIDTPTSAAVNELRVFNLSHALADELAPILQEAVNAQLGRAGGREGLPFQLPGAAPVPQDGARGPGGQPGALAAQQPKSLMLRFLAIDRRGQRHVNSGILTDVRITADPRANALLVSAPAESMDLLEALIEQLDQQPSALAEIKVFTIVNGDAPGLVDLLEGLFGRPAGQGAQLGPQPLVSGGEGSLLPLRFSVDPRTNSIIASGSQGDLAIVEAILLRLDESDMRQRQSTVYRLKNAPALDVANAINDFLRSERQVQQVTPGLVSPFEQMEREVVVVPEVVSNSLIVSATPRYYDEIRRIVEQLDARPPMVMIQVLIAEVALNNSDEFGIELGLQDSMLFDRSLLSNIQFQDTSTQQAVAGGGTITTQTQNIVAADNVPGFLFNNLPLGNSGSSRAVAGSDRVGGQGLTSFSLGRTNGELGFGGLVLSASSESVSVLIRALKECRRLDVLSRPQIMTLDNQPAFIQVGQRVPRITESTLTQVGQTNSVVLENVGLIMAVTPRISPDGLVVMEIDAEKSQLGPEAEGIPVSIAANGSVIRSPRIDTSTAQTTISALDGQTVVFAGLITKNKSVTQRRVPLLSEVPVLGHLFRFDGIVNRKTELLIIMTPHIVRNEGDAEAIKQMEAARMSWCLADVRKLHGEAGLRGRSDDWSDSETIIIYPDGEPAGARPTTTEPVPTPAPAGPRLVPNGGEGPAVEPQQNRPPPSEPPGQPLSSPSAQHPRPNQLRLRQARPAAQADPDGAATTGFDGTAPGGYDPGAAGPSGRVERTYYQEDNPPARSGE